jgi:hypothetical protein
VGRRGPPDELKTEHLTIGFGQAIAFPIVRRQRGGVLKLRIGQRGHPPRHGNLRVIQLDAEDLELPTETNGHFGCEGRDQSQELGNGPGVGAP